MTKRTAPTKITTEGPTARAPETPTGKASGAPGGKLATLIDLLRRPQGARIDEMMDATGWQAHSVRGAMSGALKKKHGLNIASDKGDGGRVYRIEAEPSA